MGLPILTDWKGDSYDSILVIVNRLIKMVYYKLVKVTIDAPGLAEVYQRSNEASRSPGLNCHRPGVDFHLKVLVIAMLFPRHQAKTLHRFPPLDRRADQKAK